MIPKLERLRPGPRFVLATLLLLALGAPTALLAQPGTLNPLPPMPFPPENPPTPEKILLGKFLFWEEQLSSDNSNACGTCHIPEFGGGDPRAFDAIAEHPGADGLFGTADDVRGSVGVPRQDCAGELVEDPSFQFRRQATGRKSPTMIMAGFAPDLFWDGRATGEFRDPLTDQVLIPSGGALETQAVAPPVSEVEMACETRDWAELTTKLATVAPLALATDLPFDMEQALLTQPDYPSLFTAAFGTPEITPTRIGFAIASYERSLVADRTPFDLFIGSGGIPPIADALTLDQQQGLLLFLDNCSTCHTGSLLTDHQFHNIGVRPSGEDLGRQEVTGNALDAGRFKTPGLRNIALRAPYFHNGGKATLDDVLAFYTGGGDFIDDIDPLMFPLGLANSDLLLIKDFLENGLTDSRVVQGLPPFDRPTLQTFFRRGDSNLDGAVDIADAIHALSILFQGQPLLCGDASDANDDGALDIADGITILSRILAGGAPLPLPSDISFGPDPTQDALGCGP